MKRLCHFIFSSVFLTIDPWLFFPLFSRPLPQRQYFSKCTAAEISYMQNKEVSKRAMAFKNAAQGDFRISHHLLNLYCT